jgi:hypothetical protein
LLMTTPLQRGDYPVSIVIAITHLWRLVNELNLKPLRLS